MEASAPTGFSWIQSNVTELLAGVFASALPDASPLLARELVVVARPGMDRWLAQFLAGRHAIAWDLQSIPLRKLWVEVARATGTPWHRLRQTAPSRLRFRVAQCLGQLPDAPVWATIAPHCSAPHRAFEFAQVQAALFEQYLDTRPEVLEAWEQGAAPEDWQAELWRMLWPADDAGNIDGPVAQTKLLMQRLSSLDASASKALREALGPRIHVFGCAQVSEPTLLLLKALGAHVQVRGYRVVPSPGFLGQTQEEHALLHAWSAGYTKASLGLECLALQDEQQFDHFLEPDAQGQGSDLDRLCQSMIVASSKELTLRGDGSVQVHGCAGMMREVEVLHDRIASALLAYPHWSYEDVVVWVSDLSAYAPYIEAVFAPVEPASGPQIPYRIVDRHQGPHAPAFLALFQILDSFVLRSTREHLLDVMGLDPVKQAFGWSDETLRLLEEGIDRAQIRWGQNAAQRVAQGQPLEASNSWEQGLWRWVLGCAYQKADWADAELPLFDDAVEPLWGAAQLEEESLGQLARFLDLYFAARVQAGEPAPLSIWVSRCTSLLDNFIPASVDPRGHERVQTCLRTLLDDQAQSEAEPLAFELATFRGMLASVAQGADAAALWGRGGVTFGQLQHARPVPANMIALLGMGEGQFPRNQTVPSWSLRRTSPLRHELSSRDEDRMAMMESLLCARERWLCLYSSRDLRGEHAWSPSPLVQELKAFWASHALAQAPELEVEHPLSAFEMQAWSLSDPRLRCYQVAAWQVATAQADPQVPPAVMQAPLPGASAAELELAEFCFYFTKSSASFLSRRLGAVADADKEPWSGTEPGILERLERFQVADAVLDAALEPGRVGQLGARLAARGQLPWGQAGRAALAQVQGELDPLLAMLHAQRETEPMQARTWAPQVAGTCPAGDFVLSGQVQGWVVQGQRWVIYPAKLNAKRTLRGWVEHLFLCAGVGQGYAGTRLLGVDKKEGVQRMVWPGMDAQVAKAQLGVLVELYLLGQRWPLPIFLESGLAYAKASAKGKSHIEAIASARTKYEVASSFGVNESVQDWATQRIFGQQDALVQRVLPEQLGEAAPARWSALASDFAAIALDLWAQALASEVRV